MRIRGQIGEWPVDLTIELEPQEWAQLGRQVTASGWRSPRSTASPPPRQDDGQWAAACELLRKAGQMSGPELLDRLEGWPAAPRRASACWCACAIAHK
jgi:hypothetical protein